MLFAGFKSVIATLWYVDIVNQSRYQLQLRVNSRSMEDVDGPMIAKWFYEELSAQDAEYLEPDAIPRALDTAVRKLRESDPNPCRWAPYIHIGM